MKIIFIAVFTSFLLVTPLFAEELSFEEAVQEAQLIQIASNKLESRIIDIHLGYWVTPALDRQVPNITKPMNATEIQQLKDERNGYILEIETRIKKLKEGL